jgi:nitrite reductase/ring-hydroxylating ferredoxin subunit
MAAIVLDAMNSVRSEMTRIIGQLRAAPGTLIYLFTLLVTQLTLNTVDERIGRRVLLSESTNLHNMARAPIQVLIGSAFWTDTRPLLTYLSFVALVLVMVPVEHWLGTGRWLITIACGHIGATLATLVVTGYAVSHGLLRPAIANVSDVGVSYGLFAAVGILTYRPPRRDARYVWAALFLAGLAVALVLNHQIADLGHICAFLIGLGSASGVPVGGGTVFPAQRVVVTQPVAGTFRGLSAVCTHQGCLVNEASDGPIDCPCHGSQFTLDGADANGPAEEPLAARPIIVKDGQIVLNGPEKS